MKTKMNKVLPVIASVGVGIAAYQVMNGNVGKIKNMIPLTSNIIGVGAGMQGQQPNSQ